MRFRSDIGTDGKRVWQAGRIVTVGPRQSVELSCWLLVHQNDASAAWQAFHCHAHHEPFAADRMGTRFQSALLRLPFLGSREERASRRRLRRGPAALSRLPRGAGDATRLLPHHWATTSIRIARPGWRCKATKQGPCRCRSRRCKTDQGDAGDGRKSGGLHAPDTAGRRVRAFPALGERAEIWPERTTDADFLGTVPMSKAHVGGCRSRHPQWREHLLQQARWIMDILQPDAICMDETFAGIGYDESPDRAGPLSPHAIRFFQEMRALVRSFGEDKAFFTSDCSQDRIFVVGRRRRGRPRLCQFARQSPVSPGARTVPRRLGDKPWPSLLGASGLTSLNTAYLVSFSIACTKK